MACTGLGQIEQQSHRATRAARSKRGQSRSKGQESLCKHNRRWVAEAEIRKGGRKLKGIPGREDSI